MAEFRIVIGDPQTKRTLQKEVKGEAADSFIGMKLGSRFNGELVELSGYEFQITGGSNYAGFPMRSDIPGTGLHKILAISGVGIKNKKKYRAKKKKGLRTMKGMRQRKTVAGNTVYEKTAQINVKVVKHGSTPLFAEPAPAPEAKEGEQKAE